MVKYRTQYLLDLTDPYLTNPEFNGPNFGAGLFRKYQTNKAGTQKRPITQANCEKIR